MISMEKHILSNWTGNRYQFVTNRYCLVEPASLPKAAGIPVVLILAHGLGLHKETWEPFFEDLKRLQENNADLRESGLVTEAWSIDCPSHGDSAILNDHTLVHDSSFHSSLEYARSIMALVEAPAFASARSGKVVLIGHSGGSCAVALAMRESVRRWGAKKTLFYSFIIIESPVLATPACSLKVQSDNCRVLGNMLAEFAKKRRDKWASTEEAYDWLGKRPPFSDWDSRALRRYVDYGLRPLPTAFFPSELEGVTLKAHKSFEGEPARGEETTMAGAVLEEIHPLLPVHLIFAQLSPFRPPEGVDLLASRSGKNTFYASVTDIPDVNHLLVQEAPEIVAKAVLDTLKVPRNRHHDTKL